MTATSFINRCIRETLNGLRDGLSLFSKPSRAAVIFSLRRNQKLQICDPQNLLRGYEPKLKNIYLENSDWKKNIEEKKPDYSFNLIDPLANLQLDGLSVVPLSLTWQR